MGGCVGRWHSSSNGWVRVCMSQAPLDLIGALKIAKLSDLAPFVLCNILSRIIFDYDYWLKKCNWSQLVLMIRPVSVLDKSSLQESPVFFCVWASNVHWKSFGLSFCEKGSWQGPTPPPPLIHWLLSRTVTWSLNGGEFDESWDSLPDLQIMI